MTEQEFLDRWNSEKPAYHAWGSFVVSEIINKLNLDGKEIDSFLKIPVLSRLKRESSLVDKAFYRVEKQYVNPYAEIEDKVGCRFVVLLIENISEISKIIEDIGIWEFKSCRHFLDERNKSPLLFTYQSVHYVVSPKEDQIINGVPVNRDIKCEIQIRTLLQHAYAELTHAEIYKKKKLIEPQIQRTIAKSMALIETTDEFFSDVTLELAKGNYSYEAVSNDITDLYFDLTGYKAESAENSTMIILDAFNDVISKNLKKEIKNVFTKNTELAELISLKRGEQPLYRQGLILFLFFLLIRKKSKLLKNWPIDIEILRTIALDIGLSLDT